ncbi:tetratricopeptide repeat protein [Calothrix sp. PCC 6303]|uniref:tetratricopeptide repeat protein n=1 Tax=Calothrix sp. PCC 6303 TaxID=1170562 RepID=UPI0002EA6C60|nr:tetratricopeptide repeat protein [Calothrix sp. PCC 6303]
MSQKRSWIVNVVLILSIFGFAAVSLVPLFSGAMGDSQSSANNTTDSGKNNSSPEAIKTKLQDEARGYESVLQKEPENQTALKGLLQARLQLLSLKQGKIQDVIEPLEKLAKLDPEETKYAVLLSQAKQQIGDKEGATQALRNVLETKPGNMEALQAMVGLLMTQKKPEAALGVLQDTLTKAPQINKLEPGTVDTVAIQVLMGNIHAEQKRYGKAFDIYDQAIKSAPKDHRPIWAKALVLKDQGKMEEAKPLFSNAAALAPAQYKDEINKTATEQPSPSPTASPSPTQAP